MQTLSIARLPRSLVLLILGAVALAACDDNSTNKRGINSLGACFVDAFNQERNDEPIDASECDLEQTPRIEPFNP